MCPSEAARCLDPERWRDLMPVVREAAGRLQARGEVEVTRRGEPADPLAPGGPIRIRRVAAQPETRRTAGE
ncbi:MAG: DUF3253 domain-containing protein [Thermoleophilia bacterium]|nr:DUF3253 domain-containing protein [Thermoleophilia bacterium]